MHFKVQEILLVSSLYDTYILGEDGLLAERLLSDYQELDITQPPRIVRVATPEQALARLEARRFDLVVLVYRVLSHQAAAFAREVKSRKADLPVVVLAHDTPGLSRRLENLDRTNIDRVWVWSGDADILLGAIKSVEDQRNVEDDVRHGRVRVVIVVEDSPRHYSTLLPLLYMEIIARMQKSMDDGLNRLDRLSRLRSRPKLLLAETYEQGLAYYRQYRDNVLGLISDISFPRDEHVHPTAGLDLVDEVHADNPNLPLLLFSAESQHEARARAAGAQFVDKQGPSFVSELRSFVHEHFGFGAFCFRLPSGEEVARAASIRDFAEALKKIPDASVLFHGSHDHFSNWFMAQGEFDLAERLRPVKVDEMGSAKAVRRFLLASLDELQEQRRRGVIADFSHWLVDPQCVFARLGGGSIGGKARSVAFIDHLLAEQRFARAFPGIAIRVPHSVALGTEVFDEFMDRNELHAFVLDGPTDEDVDRRFMGSALEGWVRRDLRSVIDRMDGPLAVRSSSLLEDSLDLPLAGHYSTYLLPNDHPSRKVRLAQLCRAIKLVYASTYRRGPSAYRASASYRVEQEKMAVLVQELAGRRHGQRFYPSFSGVAQSHNVFPFGRLRAEDGMAFVALGLGKTVADGHRSLHFSPRHPQHLLQLSSVATALKSTQRDFYALQLEQGEVEWALDDAANLARLDLSAAEADGTLESVASVLDGADGVLRPGLDRAGTRVVTFENILKWEAFPLAGILARFLDIGAAAVGAPVEIEFAVDLAPRPQPPVFYFLQLRPLPLLDALGAAIDCVALDGTAVLCESAHALGHGREDFRDIVYVRPGAFDPARSARIAEELGQLVQGLKAQRRPFVLIGPGRWGSSDPWLGIPLRWDEVAGAVAIVEADILGDFSVESSQGSHFFHNLTTSRMSYLTVGKSPARGHVDWAWLEAQDPGPLGQTLPYARHLSLSEPLTVIVDGYRQRGLITRPG